ncbi:MULTISPECIES: helix-turn-helix domain-containing protein [Yersinia]|uniref:helix-turn-helix domain-containing protein n=1 Tax=Yersinia TaxID=629 RepID=UPI0005DAFDDB|nr:MULTISPECIES: helix-turn-helix transcriptional regulator [Yersinia]CQJ67421.1 two component system sensor kinase SsrB [Yersinia intermedia]
MENKQHVIIHHPCTFTRVAMKAIMTSQREKYDIKEAGCLTAFMQENNPPPVCSPTLLITHIPRRALSFVDTLDAIETLQRQANHSLTVLVLTNKVVRPVAMNFLNKYPGRCFFLDEFVSCKTVSAKVNVLLDRKGGDVPGGHFHLPNPLTARERYVLKRLMKGMTLWEIANGLALNYKTVSHHKMSALRKLGFHHINALFSEKWHLGDGSTAPDDRWLSKVNRAA